MNLPHDWLKVLYRPGKLLQAQELIQTQYIASKQIGNPFQYLIGNFRVLQGLGVTTHINNQGVRFVRVSPGRVAALLTKVWRVIYVPPFELAYSDKLYIGLTINEAKAHLEPDPILGGPILGLEGNPLLKVSVQVTTKLNHGYPIAEVDKDKVYTYQTHLPNESFYDLMFKELELRLYEQLGDFIYQGLIPTLINQQLLSISPGIAYINGHRVQTHAPQIVILTGPKVYLTKAGEAICPPVENLDIKLGGVRVGNLKVIHRIGLPILVRYPIQSVEDIASLPRIELCQVTPTLIPSPLRLPSSKSIHDTYRYLLSKTRAQSNETVTDEFHPLHTAKVTQQGIELGHYQVKINLDPYSPPHDRAIYSWQTGLSEYNQCPDTKSPYLQFKDQVLTGYNLPDTPLPLTCKGLPIEPTGVEFGNLSGNLVTPSLGHVRLMTPYDCNRPWLGSYGESNSPLLDNGFAQEFEAPQPIQVKGFSFYTQDGFTGLVVISSGSVALGWAPVFNQSGQVYVEFPTPVNVSGLFRLNLISNTKTRVGLYNLDSNVPREENLFSKRLFLSVDNQWIPIPNKDLCCELYVGKGVPDAQYETEIAVNHLEAFDGLEHDLKTQAPTGTSLNLTWFRDGVPLVDLSSFYPTHDLKLKVKATLSPNGTIPSFLGGEVKLHITRKESTWVGRDEQLNKVYNQALLLLDYELPEGALIKPFLSSDGGRTWFGFDESNITKLTGDRYLAEYRAIDLPISLLVTDVNGQAHPSPRTRGRVRLDLSTQQPHVRPIVYDVKTVYSYA